MESMKFRTGLGVVFVTCAVSVAMTGCAKFETLWGDMKSLVTVDPGEPATPPTPPEAVAQGEESGQEIAEQAAPKFATPPATTAIITSPVAMAHPIKVPVVNVFGELDGQPLKTGGSQADVGLQQHTYTDEGHDSAISIDPMGKQMVFASSRHNIKGDIYLQKVDGTSVTQLTNDAAEDAQPCFSPDGRSIAFCSTRAGSWDLYLMDTDGRNVVQLTSGPSQDMHPSFSPDGRRIVYCSVGGRSNQWEIWVLNLGTREKKMIGYGLFPTWSPDKDSDRIAFQRARQRGSRWFSIWTMDLLDGEARRVSEVAVSSNAALVSPSWSPDGKRLAFASIVEPTVQGKQKNQGPQDIWVIDSDGANRHRLTDGSGLCLTPCWSFDHRVYFISDRGGHENIWSVRAQERPNWPVASDPKRSGDRTAVGAGDASEVQK